MNKKTLSFLMLFCSAQILPATLCAAQDVKAPQPISDNNPLTQPELQKTVTLDAMNKPLSVLLSTLSQQSNVLLETENSIAAHRVSVHVPKVSLSLLMARLCDLFGHGTLPNRGYFWRRIVDTEGKSHYRLLRNHYALDEEADMLDAPQRAKKRWLKAYRDYARLPKEQCSQFKSDCPTLKNIVKLGETLDDDCPPMAEALRALSDVQLETLVVTGQVELPQLQLSPHSIEYLRKTVPAHGGIPDGIKDDTVPTHASLTISDTPVNDLPGIMGVSLGFDTGFARYCPSGLGFDTFDSMQLDDDDTMPDEAQYTGPTIDLLAHEPQQPGKQPVTTLAKALQLLAREGHLAIYAECFPKTGQMLRTTQGKPEYLLDSLCRTFGYHWIKSGHDYLVTSRTWALDRIADVPQPLLDRWESHYTRLKYMPLSDQIAIAKLRKEQIRTVCNQLRYPGPGSNRDALQLLGALGEREVEFAYQPQGMPLGTLSNAQKEIARTLFGRDTKGAVRVYLKKSIKEQIIGTVITFADEVGPALREGWAFQMSGWAKPPAE